MPDPTWWHKAITIFWLIAKWLDAKFSRQAKIEKETKNGFKEALDKHDSDGVFRNWNKMRRSKK